jgi:TRAP-type C4-dicarboxylate transport system substrate-binding protein
MLRPWLRCAITACALLPVAAAAEPTKLKLGFLTSDRSVDYRAAIQPFVDKVNEEAKGVAEIEVYLSGSLGGTWAQQPQMVLDGVADLSWVLPSASPDRFPDTSVIELPGLYRDLSEATLVYTRLVAAHRLTGYDDFVVIGATAFEPESIHSRAPVSGLGDLQGRRVRATTATEAAALEKLGMIPVVMPITQAAEALGGGRIDATTATPARIGDFGIRRIATNHYLLRISSVPVALLMSRKSFDRLPAGAQDVIRKYSGEWTAARYIPVEQGNDGQVLEQLRADPKRQVTFPSPSDQERAQAAFKAVIGEFAARSQHNRELLQAVEAELARIRSSEEH